MTKTGFHLLPVAECQQDPAGATILGFAVPDALQADFTFLPGQYLTLQAEIEGAEVRRPYSICSSPGGGLLQVGIRQIEAGRFSQFARHLKPGDQLSVMPPQGRFTLKNPKPGQHLLLAAGSGITPILPIAEALLADHPDCSVMLIWGNRQRSSIMLKEAVDGLKNRFMGRFSLLHILSREAGDQPLFSGRLDAARLRQLSEAGLFDASQLAEAWICGPAEMSADCLAWLGEQGMAQKDLHTEVFTPAPPSRQKGQIKGPASAQDRAAKPAAADSQPACTVRVILDGAEQEFPLPDGLSVIEAAREARISLPWSCANGMCATCRCRLTSGAGQMQQNFSLDEAELEAGFVLACQLIPQSPHLTLDFDQS